MRGSELRDLVLRRATVIALATLSVLVASLLQPGVAEAATHVSSTTISSNATWTVAGSPFILDGSVTVAAGATLTIEPGVVVKLNGQLRTLTVNGTMIAVGTRSAPITFTSAQDDSAGGDSNADGAATQPAPGQWYQIHFGAGSGGSQLEWLDVRYGGWGSAATAYGAISVGGVVLAMEEVSVSYSQRSGIKIGSGGNLWLYRSTIAKNENGISVNNGSVGVEQSTVLENSKDGIWFNLVSSFAGPASSVMDSDVKRNGENGIDIWVDRTLPVAKWPHGTRSNIYKNASGDELALTVFKRAGKYLGIGLANLMSFIDPEIIVISGGVVNGWDLFAADMYQEVSERAFRATAQQVKIARAECGDNAGLLGAARLAFDEMA